MNSMLPVSDTESRINFLQRLRIAIGAGSIAFALNLCILFLLVPTAQGFRPIIVAQIAFWTLFAAIGAGIVSAIVWRYVRASRLVFIALSLCVMALSFIPMYFHAGIIHMFPATLTGTVIRALAVMHITDSFLIAGVLLAW